MSIPSALHVSFLGNNIERWAQKYGHSWLETYDKSQQVLVEGKLQDWSLVASDILKGNKLNSSWRYDHTGFHIIHRNCSAYTAEILADHLGIEINNQEFISEALHRKLLASVGIRRLPTFIRVIFTVIG